MRRRYEDELAELAATWAALQRASPVREILDVRSRLFPGPAVFVGSGGALAVATLAADEHTERTGQLAVATTPLGLTGGLGRVGAPVVLVSARAKHPDVLAAARTAAAGNAPLIALLTAVDPDHLTPALASSVDVVMPFHTPVPDGFLATNSVLAACAAWLRDDQELPDLPSLHASAAYPDFSGVTRLVVVHGARTRSVAVDLEARCNEVGLLDVQLTDFRNLAHGRHVGLSARSANSAIVSVSDPADTALVNATLSTLRDATPLIDLRTPHKFPFGTIDLMVASMRVAGAVASAKGIDPGRPRVPRFGRDLYHMGWGPRTTRRDAAVQRKVAAAGSLLTEQGLVKVYAASHSEWKRFMARATFSSIVLDYDGTCCTTEGRFALPAEAVRGELLRLLGQGMRLAFASGRGKSLHEDLRSWIPELYWSSITLGLYNGGLLVTLSDSLPTPHAAEGVLSRVAERLELESRRFGFIVEVRPWQVTVLSSAGHAQGTRLVDIVRTIVARERDLVRTAASGHSVDVIPCESGKASVVDRMLTSTTHEVVAIGDQGHVGGNDFELLSSMRSSLSVDTCSPDPTRCWNLGSASERGPDLLVRYLQSVQTTGDHGVFRWTWR